MPVLLLAFLLLAPHLCTANDAVLLRYRLAPGDSCAYKLTLRTGMAVRGFSGSAGSTLHSDVAVRTTDTTASQIGIDVRVSGMTTSLRGAPGMRDTTIAAADSNNRNLRVILTRTGDILFAWPSAELAKAYQTHSFVAGGGIENSLRKIFLSYPADSLRPGSTWSTTSVDTSSPGTGGTVVTRIAATMTYEGRADTLGLHCARIAVAAPSVDVEGSGTFNGQQILVSGTGSLVGIYYVELASGMPVSGVLRTDIDLLFFPQRQAAQGERSRPVSMHTSTDLEVVRSGRR